RIAIKQLIDAFQPVFLIAVGAGQASCADKSGGWANQGNAPAITAQEQGLDGRGIVQLGVIQAEQHIAVIKHAVQRACVVAVGPELGTDLKLMAGRGLANLIDQKAAVIAVKHANALRLGQEFADQVELACNGRVTPQECNVQRLTFMKDL